MKTSIKNFLEDPVNNSDKFSNYFDWFCNTNSLENKMKKLLPKIKFLVKVGILDEDETYCWFKNNCPASGPLYDDIRISDLSSENNYLGGFWTKTGHNVEDKCAIWFYENDEFVTLNFKNWSEFKKELKNNQELVAKLAVAFSSK